MVKKINLEKTIIILIIFSGIIISILQFIYNRSLWLDEAYLSLNIINKSQFELLKPLDLRQVAPVLFLQIEKLFSELIRNSEFGLRIFPLISFFFSLFLFYKIIKKIHQNYFTIIFSLSLFVFNPTLIYYSSEVKQYMTDVLVLTYSYYIIIKSYKKEENKYYLLGIIGAVSIFLSNVAPIILFTAGFYLLLDIYRNNKKEVLSLTVISIVWASSFFVYYLMFVHNHPSRNFMITEWDNYKAFMPTDPLTIEFYRFIYRKGSMIVHSLFQFGRMGGVGLSILLLIGIISLIKKRKIDIIILSIIPLILHLIFSSFKLYPFEKRFILYTGPCLIIIYSFGFNYLVNTFVADFKIKTFGILVIFIPLIMSFYFYRVGFPIKNLEIKESIKFIERNMYKGDKIYVNYFSRIPFRYYSEISFIKRDTNNIVIGKRNNMVWNGNRMKYVADTLNYSNEVSLLRGRVWFLFTSIGDENEKMEFLINYFDSKGINIIQKFHTKGSDVYLYNISNEQDVRAPQ
jgi:hypothetical protein